MFYYWIDVWCFIAGLVFDVLYRLMFDVSLGILVSFISYPVINAFTSAAAITIAAGQVKVRGFMTITN